MAKKAKALGGERHVLLGKQLRDARQLFGSLHGELAETYGANSKAGRKALAVLKAISRLRCEMDDILARETTTEEWHGGSLTKVYYPDTTAYMGTS